MKFTLAAAIGISASLSFPVAAFETPRDEDAAKYLGANVQGPGYTVSPVVPSDGLLRQFTFETPNGRFRVDGVDLARQRVRELHALDRLKRMSESDVFTKALGQAAMAPVQFGANLVTDPSKTLERTFSGIGNMFDRLQASADNQKSSRDTVAGSLIGTDTARRHIAVELGVDPYTDYQPLAQRLETIAQASALGGLSVRAAMMAIPGPGGAVISYSSTINSVQDTLRERTSSQIIQYVRTALSRLKVSSVDISRLVDNRFYTPADLLIMTNALTRLKAGNTSLFIARALQANTRDLAYFQRRRAELLAEHSARLGGITDFVSVGTFPLNRTRDGKVVALFPLDDVIWTESMGRGFMTITGDLRLTGYQDAPVLATTAAVTPMANAEIKKLGWTIVTLN